jgi:phosphoribosylanthranilate isomerase
MKTKTIIKVCGITTVDDALGCVAQGVTWLGFNCFAGSQRYATPEAIRAMVAELPPETVTVGVFVNLNATELQDVMRFTGLRYAQLHGDESPEFARSLAVPWFRAFRVGAAFETSVIAEFGTELFLLDAAHAGEYGGTGQTFDWELAKQARDQGRLLLAGGLRPANVGAAVQQVRPFGVDVASGVEWSPGRKDMQKVAAFVQAVAQAE